MHAYRQLTLGLDWEPVDEAIEELLARVAEGDAPYYGYHGCVDGMGDAEPVAVESDDDQA